MSDAEAPTDARQDGRWLLSQLGSPSEYKSSLQKSVQDALLDEQDEQSLKELASKQVAVDAIQEAISIATEHLERATVLSSSNLSAMFENVGCCLSLMEVRSTVRLVEFLCIVASFSHSDDNDTATTTTTTTEKTKSSGLQTSAVEILKILFTSLERTISEHNHYAVDDKASALGQPGLLQVLRMIHRRINSLLSTYPYLLVPLYTGFSSILQTHAAKKDSNLDETALTLCSDLADAMILHLQSGYSYMEEAEGNDQQKSFLLARLRLLGFLVSKLNIIMLCWRRASNTASEKEKKTNNNSLHSYFSLMTKLRSLSCSGRALLLKNKKEAEKLGRIIDTSISRLILPHREPAAAIDHSAFHLFANLHSRTHLQDFALGKSLVLRALLGRLVKTCERQTQKQRHPETNTIHLSDAALQTSEILLFSTLPCCCLRPFAIHALLRQALVAEIVQQVTQCTFLCQRILPPSCNLDQPMVCGRSQVHRTLARWLAPSTMEGGMTREIVLAIVLGHLVPGWKGKRLRKRCASLRFLSLLSNLLFDPRTRTGHRRNIAAVFQRLWQLDDSAKDFAGAHIRKAFHRRFGLHDNTAELNYSIKDIYVLMPVLEAGGLTDLDEFSIFLNRLADSRHRQGIADMDAATSAVSAALAVLVNSGNVSDTNRSFLWRLLPQRTSAQAIISLEAWTSLRALRSMIQRPGREVDDALVAKCLAAIRAWISEQKRPESPSTTIELALLLGQLGTFLSSSSSQALLNSISMAFLACFHPKQRWPLHAVTMTSLENFASTMLPMHKSMLPDCLTVEMQPLLQSRLDEKIYDSRRNQTHSWSEICNIEKWRKPRIAPNFIEPRRHHRYPRNTDLVIPPGSMVYSFEKDGTSVIVLGKGGGTVAARFSDLLGRETLRGMTADMVECRLRVHSADRCTNSG